MVCVCDPAQHSQGQRAPTQETWCQSFYIKTVGQDSNVPLTDYCSVKYQSTWKPFLAALCDCDCSMVQFVWVMSKQTRHSILACANPRGDGQFQNQPKLVHLSIKG